MQRQKRWGQNFLTDKNIARDIATAAEITSQDTVLEIGPGKGILTHQIARKAKKVLAIEIDKQLCAQLKKSFNGNTKVEIINADFLKFDFTPHALRLTPYKLKVVGNIPYSITTPLLLKLLKPSTLNSQLSTLVLMLQKEVAQRLIANPGTKDYGVLTLTAQYYMNIELIKCVKKEAFRPIPRVDSAVVKFTRLSNPRVKVKDESLFFRIIKIGFHQRRKMLLRPLSDFPGLQLSRKELNTIFMQNNIPLNSRSENLNIQDFANLSNDIFQPRIDTNLH